MENNAGTIYRSGECNPDTTVQEEKQKYFDKYRGISAQCAWQNVGFILLETMQAIIDPQLMEVQCGFGKERSTVDEIRVMRQVVEKETEYKATVFLYFNDFTKAYDSVNHQAMVLKRVWGSTIWQEPLNSSTRKPGATSGQQETHHRVLK